MKQKLPVILLVIYIIYFCILGIKPYSRPVWFVENMTIVPIVLFLAFTYRKFQFSNASYIMMSFLIFMHTFGGHFTFERVPFAFITDLFSFQRNHYDRIAHFSVGFYAFPVAEYIQRKKLSNSLVLTLLFGVFTICTVALLYEVFEWRYAVSADPNARIAVLGSQGDIWDAQKDMLADILGAVAAAIMFYLQLKRKTIIIYLRPAMWKKKGIFIVILSVLIHIAGCNKKNEKGSGRSSVDSLMAPVISNLRYISGLERTEIAWTTDKGATTQVLLGTTSQTYNFATTEDGTLIKEHLIYLSPLVSNTTYYFKVLSKDVDYLTAMSDEYSLVTPALYLPDTTKVLIEGDNNKTFIQLVNDLLELQLEENGATGYGWHFSGFDPDYFEVVTNGTRVLKPMIGGAGAPVLAYWQIKLNKAGSADIKMKYYRSWENESSSIKDYTVSLQIQ